MTESRCIVVASASQRCEELAHGHGLCSSHYWRWRTHGDDFDRSLIYRRGQSEHDRFWAHVAVGDDTVCWPWLASLDISGYGCFVWHGGSLAHRFAYTEAFGPVPPRRHVGHLCHDDDDDCTGGDQCQHRRCCSPYHLAVQTPKENALLRQHFRSHTFAISLQ